jgi:outer membrane protein OmpA-like peptidoglycan-associated protein
MEIGVCLFAVVAATGALAEGDAVVAWGESGALPEPQPDRGAAICLGDAREASWWWPKAAADEGDDTRWGNGGVVFHQWVKAEKSVTVVCPPPIPPPPPMVSCGWPFFNNILFEHHKAVLIPGAVPVLDQNIALFNEMPELTVLVEGHACDLGSPEYNMALGLRRAEVVKQYMIEHGIDAARICTRSYGDTEPAVPNDSDLNRKLNRRVNFIVAPSNPCSPQAVR